MPRIVLAAVAALALVSCGGGGDGVTAVDTTVSAGAMSFAAVGPSALAQATLSARKQPDLRAGQVSRVNSTSLGNQELRAVGAIGDGGYVVAWASGGTSLYIRAFDGAGIATGPETGVAIDIAAPTPDAAAAAIELSSLAVLSDGTVVVVYRISRDLAMPGGFVQTTSGVYFQRFDRHGRMLTPETQVASQAFAGPKGPFIAQFEALALSHGGFAVGWSVAHYSTQFGSISTLALRWFDGQGNAVGPPTEVGDFPELTFGMVADTHGGFTLSTVRTDNFYMRDSDILHYDSSHAFLEVVPPTRSQVLLLALEQGYVLFAADGTGATQQPLDARGAALGTPLQIPSLPVAARELADGTYVTLARGGNGAFTIGWFTADSTPLDAQLEIRSAGVVPLWVSLADGGFAAAWTGASANEGTDVYTQSFEESKWNRKKKACLEGVKRQRLTGQARKARIDACMD